MAPYRVQLIETGWPNESTPAESTSTTANGRSPESGLLSPVERRTALSSSIATKLPTAHTTIIACQAAGTPVIAGGAAFGTDGRHARLLGADAWAPDARAAADRLLTGLDPRPARQPLDNLPHLADQEYTLVSNSSQQFVSAVFHALEQRIPAVRDYTERQLQHTAEDLAHIDDEALFVDFITGPRTSSPPEACPPGSS